MRKKLLKGGTVAVRVAEKAKEAARKGFTLVELLIVVSLVAILAVGTWMAYKGYVKGAKATKIADEVGKLTSAVNLFNQQTGYFPDDIKELWVNDDGNGNAIPGWSGPYVMPQGGDTSATSLKSGSGASITMTCGTDGVKLVFNNVPQNVAEEYDQKYDNGDTSSGNAVYDSTNKTLSITISKSNTCI